MDKRSLFILLSLLAIGSSYDTGHHSDLTRNAMEILGYNGNAQLVGSISNWFVDYFSYTPTTEGIDNLKSLHFDNLYHLLNISNYMTQLVRNTMNATRYAVNQNDPVTFLAILGASCHAVQDFYTHSSWAEHHQTSCGCYRDDTWFSDLAGANGNVTYLFDKLQSVATYSWGDGCNEFERNCLPGQVIHGGYCEGINKDSYVRPWFERSYGHSMAASIEWIYNMQLWVENITGSFDFVNSAKSYAPSDDDLKDLNEDFVASIEVSYATKVPLDGEEDGHYKGAGSGDYKRLAASSVKFTARSSTYKKKFTDEKVWQYLTSPNLYDVENYDQNTLNDSISAAIELVVPYTLLPSQYTNLQKIKVRTLSADVSKKVGRPSPYAIVTVGGMAFYEAVQHNQGSFNPHWTTIKYIPASNGTIQIKYELWDDQFPQSDQHKPIVSDSDGDLDLTYNIEDHSVSGDVSGTFDTNNSPLSTNSDDNKVAIYITTQQAGQCVLQGNPEPYCPLEAYTELRVYHSCDYDSDSDSLSGSMASIPALFFTVSAAVSALLI